MILVTAAVLLILSVSSPISGDGLKSEEQLKRDLFRRYNKDIKPVRNAVTPVVVQISVIPLNVKLMGEKDQKICVETFMKVTWTDEFLTWDPSQYDNITELRVSSLNIWRPDVVLYNADPFWPRIRSRKPDVTLHSSGRVLWVPPFTMKSRDPVSAQNCDAASRAPIECPFRMRSGGEMVDFYDAVDLTNFSDNNQERKLAKKLSNSEPGQRYCCTGSYSGANFNVTLKKRDNYYSKQNDNEDPRFRCKNFEMTQRQSCKYDHFLVCCHRLSIVL